LNLKLKDEIISFFTCCLLVSVCHKFNKSLTIPRKAPV